MDSGLYFIALLPPEPIREKVSDLKLEMRQRFGAKHALKSPAHITLQMPFRLQAVAVGKLEDILRRFSGRQNQFAIRLRDFGCFAPRVIFIKINDHGPTMELGQQLKTVLQDTEFTQKKGAAFHPHMTIATRDLPEPSFAKAWGEFKNRSFDEEFLVSSLFLLKHNGSFWGIFREFGFGNLIE